MDGVSVGERFGRVECGRKSALGMASVTEDGADGQQGLGAGAATTAVEHRMPFNAAWPGPKGALAVYRPPEWPGHFKQSSVSPDEMERSR